MSNTAINAVKRILTRRDVALKSRSRLLLLLLADHAGKDGTCYPSRKTLAALAGASEASIKRDMAVLERQSFIKRHVRRAANGAQSANLIEIVGIVQGGSDCAGGRLKAEPGEAHSCEPEGGSLVIPAYKEEPSLEPSAKPSVVATAETRSAKIDTAELHRKLLTAANGALCPMAKGTGLVSVAEPIGWIQQGADVDLDILPAIAAIAHRVRPGTIRAWSYYRGAVADFKNARERGLPPPSASVSNGSAGKPSHMRRYG